MLEAAPKWLQRALCLPFPPKPPLRRGPPLALQGALVPLAPVRGPVLPTPRCATGSTAQVHALQHRYRLQSTSACTSTILAQGTIVAEQARNMKGTCQPMHGRDQRMMGMARYGWTCLLSRRCSPRPTRSLTPASSFFFLLYLIQLLSFPSRSTRLFLFLLFCFFLLRRLAFATKAP